jgi:hypothetical protein
VRIIFISKVFHPYGNEIRMGLRDSIIYILFQESIMLESDSFGWYHRGHLMLFICRLRLLMWGFEGLCCLAALQRNQGSEVSVYVEEGILI